MLKASASQHGFNLIEILITLTVLGVLIALGAPSLAEFLQNQQIRAAAEAMVNGLQVARGEAIRRNLAVKLVLELPTGWTVCEAAVEPCDSTIIAADEALPADQKKVIQARSSGEGTGNAEAKQTPDNTVAVTFSPLGNVLIKNADESVPLTRIDFFNTRNACIADGGPLRCLRVVVNAGGSVRMCDPTPGIAFPDPRACP